MRTKRALAVSRMKVVQTTAMTTLRRLRSLGVNTSDSATTTDDDYGEGELLAPLALASVDVVPPPSSPTKSTRHFLLAEVNRLLLLLPTEGAEITWCWSLLRMTTAAVGLLRSVQMTAGASKKPLVCSALKVYSC